MDLMEKIKILLMCLLVTGTASAQVQITPVLQSSLGVFSQGGGYSLSYSVGESFVTTESGGGYFLTQGFQQPMLPTVVDTTDTTTTPVLENFHIYNAFSPNGDDVNDKWIIDGITEFENNTVMIFNRWGDQLNKFENYNNRDVVWDGRSEGGGDIPDGTYYYIIETEIEKFSGWVQVTR